MKRTLLLLLCIGGTSLWSQVASTECIVEVKAVYGHIDHNKLLQRDQATRIRYEHRYIMKTDPQAERKGGEETRTYTRDFMHHLTSEFESCTDAKEAFYHSKFQFMVYRTAPTLAKAGLVPGMDQGIFDQCLVRRCNFVPAPGEDSTSYKEAFLTVNPAGQQKYKVKDLNLTWNPLNAQIVSLKVNFTDRSRTKEATYTFLEIDDAYTPETPLGDAAALFLEGDALARRFQGSELKDYR
ncbi:MAG: hypothetical protein AAGN35_09340 [Bacteroidota bacterium]